MNERTAGTDEAGAVLDADAQEHAEPEADAQEQSLLLDELSERFERFRAFRKSDQAATDAIFDEIGASSELDRQIVLELSATRALGQPERFAQAHVLVVRALEVLDRNGARKVRVPRLGPLTAVARYLVTLVTRFIVRSYEGSIVDKLRVLYQRREAECLVGDPDLPPLRRARIHMERLSPGFKGGAVGLPAFVLGGAAISSVLSMLRATAALATSTSAATIVASVVVALLFGALGWCGWQGAAVARRRIRLTVEKPLAALWETMGRCGNPPKDQARTFGFIALLATGLCWVVIPVGIAIALL